MCKNTRDILPPEIAGAITKAARACLRSTVAVLERTAGKRDIGRKATVTVELSAYRPRIPALGSSRTCAITSATS